MQAPRNQRPEPKPHETEASASDIGIGSSGFGLRDSRNDGPSSSANPESRTPDPVSSPKPKRKYTVSEKSRAASLRNLVLANQAPHWLKYRRTDRRDAACYKALEKAVAEMRRFDSPHYGLGFKRGTSCASLLRSLALAGETREEYEAHLERMRKAFAPLSEPDRKLVLAAAQAVWRRLRVFGGQGRWELYAVAGILAEMIAEREAEAERRAAAEGAGEKVQPVDPYHDPFGHERAQMLGIHLIGLLQEDGVEKEAGRLNRRIQMLLAALGQEPEPTEEDGVAASAETDDEAEQSAAVNGNPLGQPQRLAATLNLQREPLKDPSHWRDASGAGPGAEPDAAGGTGGKGAGQRKPDPHPCENVRDLAQRGGLMRLLHRQGANNPEFSRLEGPDGKAVWIDLWQRAFGIDDSSVVRGPSSVAATDHGPRTTDSPFQSSIDHRQSAILHTAEITWERIQMHLQHREKEAAQVKEVLEARIAQIADCSRSAGTIDDSPGTVVAGGPSSVAATDHGPRTGRLDRQSRIDNRQFCCWGRWEFTSAWGRCWRRARTLRRRTTGCWWRSTVTFPALSFSSPRSRPSTSE